MAAGEDHAALWALTPRQVDLVLSGHIERATAEIRLKRAMQYDQAHLIAVAVRNPKALPDRDKWIGTKRARVAAPGEQRSIFKRFRKEK